MIAAELLVFGSNTWNCVKVQIISIMNWSYNCLQMVIFHYLKPQQKKKKKQKP